MPVYIFDLNSPCNNNENYQVEVKICVQTLDDDDDPSIDQDSDDIKCEKNDHHEESPFFLNQNHQSQRIETDCNEICYRVNNGNWRRYQNGGNISI